MSRLKIFYSASNYMSHRRAALSYCGHLRARCNLVSSWRDADVVILHHEPHDFGTLYDRCPSLRDKYVIGYCVWEADRLPESYRRSLSHIQEVWTPSRYCVNVFRQFHNRVVHIPHLIERQMSCSDADRGFVRGAVGFREECIYYLSVTRVVDKRKNVRTLVNAFLETCAAMKHSRLILKARPRDPGDFVEHPQIIYLRAALTERQLNALYEMSHVYVSAHHSEAWGFTLSDAILFGKPAIATGYSGNLEFMSQDNSLLVEYKEEEIRPQDYQGLFGPGMRWAYPIQQDLEAKMLLMYSDLNERWVAKMVHRASMDAGRFDGCAVEALLQERLAELETAV